LRHVIPFIIVLLPFSFVSNAQLKRFSFSQPKMGSPFNIIFYHHDSLQAHTYAASSFLLVDSFVNIFSDYIDSSELNRLAHYSPVNKWVSVSPALFDILQESRKAYKSSNGAFDITIGPVVKLWRKARREKKIPDPSEISKLMRHVGFNKLELDPSRKAARIKDSSMQLDLGGIAQGYIARKVLERLKILGVSRALVDVSGDIALGDAPPDKRGWTIGVNLPKSADRLLDQKLLLKNCAVSTSGDVYQFIEFGGKRYSHIIDPKTGYGVTTQRNVTVIAPDATMADWLATACSILSIRKSKRLARKMNAELMIATIVNDKLLLHTTKGFKNYSL